MALATILSSADVLALGFISFQVCGDNVSQN